MTDYTKLIPHILLWETGSPDGWSVKAAKGDPGGWTVSGLTFGTYKLLAKQILGILPTFEHFKSLTRNEWQKFVKYFWDKYTLNGSIHSQAVSEMVVDFAWGSKYAIRQVQRMLNTKFGKNLKDDNIIGTQTVAALNSVPEKQLVDAIAQARVDYYKTLSTWNLFGKGWTNRVNSLYNGVMQYIKNNPIKSIGFFLPFLEYYGQ